MRERFFSYIIACGLTCIGLLTLVGLLSSVPGLGLERLRESPGGFLSGYLFRSFSYAAFFIPLVLFLNSALLIHPIFRPDLLLLLSAAVVPFFTAVLVFKLFSPAGHDGSLAAEALSRAFTRPGAGIFSALLLIIEIVLFPRLKRFLSLRFARYGAQSAPGSRRGGGIAAAAQESQGVDCAAGARLFLPILPETLHGRFTCEPPAADADGPFAGEPPATGPADADGPFAGEPPAVDAADVDAADAGPFAGEPRARPERRRSSGGTYAVPVDGILKVYAEGRYWEIDDETRRAAQVLRETLEEFRIQAEVTGIRKGPVITMFEILPAPGVKLSKIVNLSDNIALRLAAQSVRIVAPIPGKHAVGIEVPNKTRAIVSFAEMIGDGKFTSAKMEIPIALGKDITGEAQIVDLTQTPHLLIAGATGSGKSVCVNSIICSILYMRSPREVRLILIDPKIVELKFYNDIPHLLTPVITEPKRAFQAIQYALSEMERRYSLLDALGVRDVKSYNRKIGSKKLATEPLPYLVMVVDEFADLMATTGKELEGALARLAAMSRAVGIHLVLATQRPSIDVITGLIKANIPSRIAFMVAGKFDSRIIIDAVGAEKLLGRGDLLFTAAWDPFPVRMQGAYVTEEEVERIVEHVRTLGQPEYIDEEIFFDDEDEEEYFEDSADDPLMDKALEIVKLSGKASASYLQRRLKIGYNRAARMVECMERRGIVGPQQGSKPREVIRD